MIDERCKDCSLFLEVQELKKLVAELQKRLDKYEKAEKNSSNSSVPSSTDRYNKKYPQRQPSQRKSGGQNEHIGYTKKQVDNPDEIIELTPEKCAVCGCEHLIKQIDSFKTRQVFDIPIVFPFITEYQQMVALCPNCGKKNKVNFPDDVKANTQLGQNTLSTIGYLNVQNHLSYKRIKQLFKHLFHFDISEGTIDLKIKALENKLLPTYDNILENLKASGIIGSDETGTRVAKENWQQWVFQNTNFSYFKTDKSRGFNVIEQLFGKIFYGFWISDRLGSQLKIQALHQLCLAHLIRECRYLIETEKSNWASRLKKILEYGINFKNSKEDFNPNAVEEYQTIERIKRALNKLFQKIPEEDGARKLYKGLVGRQKQLIMFLTDSDVPATNNGSEQALRNRVVHRKVCGCFRSGTGAGSHDVIASIIETAKKQKQDILFALTNPNACFNF